MNRNYKIEVFRYFATTNGVDWERCADEAPDAEFEVIEYTNADCVGECVAVCYSRAEAETMIASKVQAWIAPRIALEAP
jgi:hypothetical protein